MSSETHPIVLAAAIGALCGLAAVVTACIVRSGGVKALMICLALLCLLPGGLILLASFPELIDGRFRTYKRFHRDIQMGMTREQVLAKMEQRYPTNGPRQRPKIMRDTETAIGFFMNPENSREPNCEGIFLKLEGGKVIKIDYSPD